MRWGNINSTSRLRGPWQGSMQVRKAKTSALGGHVSCMAGNVCRFHTSMYFTKFISLLAFATQIFTLISVEFEMLHLDPSLLHRRLSCSHAKVNDIGWHPIKWISRSSSINAGQYANIFQTGTQDWWHNTYAVKLPAYLGWWKAWKYLPNQGVQIMPPRTNPSQGFV